MSEEKEFKQGRARKINEYNFYLTLRYLFLQTYDQKRLAFSDLKDEIHALNDTAPREDTSKNYINKRIDELELEIRTLEDRIYVNQYPVYSSRKITEDRIEKKQAEIQRLRDSYIELSDKMMFELHEIVVELDDSIYKKMTNWVKQNRARAKEYKRQITLSNHAFEALKEMKSTLNAKNYDEAIMKISNYAKQRDWN